MDDLWQHIAYTMGYAPANFPVEDFLEPHQQMNLELAFEQLREGVLIAYPEDGATAKRLILNELLAESYSAYKAGDEIRGVMLLVSFQNSIFKRQES